MDYKGVYYSEYLQLDKILEAQTLESDKQNAHGHDEMLFIVIHQAYELWFKQILWEVDSAVAIMSKPIVDDDSDDLQTIVHRMGRVIEILKVLVQQIDILETMTPLDFLDFRDFLRPASGFQSIQWKILEAKLGLKYENRYGQEYYLSQLKPHDRQKVEDAEKTTSFIVLLNKWLERCPYFDNDEKWKSFEGKSTAEMHAFWNTYKATYTASLSEREMGNLEHFESTFFKEDETRSLSAKANRAALFIMLYRGYPIFHLPFELLQCLLDIDEQMATWRFRHINMVHRMIGGRMGTGGSTGKEYLQGALSKHYIFKEIAGLTSYMMERRKLPKLPNEVFH
jgi:tryptophan 2,3-dioxygenase